MAKKFKILISFLLAISLLFSSAELHAENKAIPKTTATQTKQQVKSNVSLWEVTPKNSKNSKQKVYLLGSIHAAKNIYPLDKRIENSFNSSEYLVVESNPQKETEKQRTERLARYFMYKGKETLEDNLAADVYEKLGNIFTTYGMDIKDFNKMKPFFISGILEVATAESLGYKVQNGIDMYFMGKAGGKKKILELESPDTVYKNISTIPDEVELKMLQYKIYEYDNMGAIEKELIDLFKYWKAGDAKGMEGMCFKLLKEDKELQPHFNKLVFDRNVNMTKKVEGYLKDNKTYFVIAGAAHMLGQKGIVNLLKEKGYNVKQL